MGTVSGRANKPFVIRDPVHGYLTVAVHERIVVDHPVTQRLRRIAQTGLAEMVFPEANTSRFVHSLGAMHLASRFVVACLENATHEVRGSFFTEIEGICDWLTLDELDPLLKRNGTLTALRAGRALFDERGAEEVRQRRLLALVESGLRFAALFHDLGHLPFSHDAEYALQEYVKKRLPKAQRGQNLLAIAAADAPHEEIGHRLAKLVFNDLVKDEDPSTRAAFQMGLRILNASPPEYHLHERPRTGALAWLHSLVDGEIDVDRADYILRDGQALGLDFASYDLDRLVANLVLEREEDLGYITAVREAGLAALESYCISRSRSTEVFIHHHKVAQTAAALRYSSLAAYETSRGKKLIEFLSKLGSTQSDTGLLGEFAEFDDGWWIETLREVRRSETQNGLLSSCLGLVLDRERSMFSLWKRLGDLTDEEAKVINRAADSFFGTSTGSRMAAVVDSLEEKQILIHRFGFKPFLRRPTETVNKSTPEAIDEVTSANTRRSTGESVMLVRTRERGLQPASRVSTRIAALQAAWDAEIHLYAFTPRLDLATAKTEVLAFADLTVALSEE